MTSQSAAAGMSNDMNVTPLIDVLLVLLIIFMLTMPHQQSIDVQLPDPSKSASSDGASIVLEVMPGGAYRINQREVPEGQLGARLLEVYSTRPEKVLLVKGSPDVRYQEVIVAMDVARGAGVRVIGAYPDERGIHR